VFKRLRIAVILAIVVGASFVGYLSTRPIAFDSAEWKAGDPKLRFRMKDSLMAAYAAGALRNRATFDALLGPDDEPGRAPEYRYFHLTEWYGNPWYLRARFDEQENMVQLVIAPD
jgi:hypothetical protein